MKFALLSKEEILASDLVRASFAIRSARMTPDRVAHLVLWLVSEFLYGRCAWPASAAAHAVGADRYVAFLRPDRRLAHAVLACEPQRGSFLIGDCVDMMGRRSLESVYLAVESEVGAVGVSVAAPIPREAFGGDEHLYLSLAEELPWFREAMGVDRRPLDGGRLLAAAVALGYDPGEDP